MPAGVVLALGVAFAPQNGVFANPVWEASFPDPTTWRAPDGTWRATSTSLKILKSGDGYTGKMHRVRLSPDGRSLAPDAKYEHGSTFGVVDFRHGYIV